MKNFLLFAVIAVFSMSVHAGNGGGSWGWEEPETEDPGQNQDQDQDQNQRQTNLQGQDQNQGQGQLQGQGQGQGQSLYNQQELDSRSSAYSGSYSGGSKSGADAKSNSQSNADSNSNSDSNSYSGSYSGGSKSSAGSYSGGSSSGAKTGDQATSVKIKYEAVSARAATLDLPYCGEGVSAQADKGGFAMANTNFICESSMALKMTLMLVEMEIAGYDKNAENDVDLADDHLIKANEYMLQSEDIIREVQSYISVRGSTAAVGAVSKDFLSPILTIGLLILLL